jgi:hypothetical protein
MTRFPRIASALLEYAKLRHATWQPGQVIEIVLAWLLRYFV